MNKVMMLVAAVGLAFAIVGCCSCAKKGCCANCTPGQSCSCGCGQTTCTCNTNCSCSK